MDITINELSAKTFNWLGMNESVVKDVPMRFSADIRGFTGKIFYPEMAFRGPRICLCERCFLKTPS